MVPPWRIHHLKGKAGDTLCPLLRRIDAQLGDLVLGWRDERRTPEDSILVNPFSLVLEDVALCYHVYQATHRLTIGTVLES